MSVGGYVQVGKIGRAVSVGVLAFVMMCGVGTMMGQNAVDLKPSPQQSAWQDLEFGVIIHFGPNTFLNQEWGDGTADAKVFNPSQFDPDQWMKAIKASGATYVVMVAKHHDGFALWPTTQSDYSVKASPFKGDVVGDVARAARANGLRFGVYLSPWDRHDPRYKEADPKAYDAFYQAQLEELVTHYGDLVERWANGDYVPLLYSAKAVRAAAELEITLVPRHE